MMTIIRTFLTILLAGLCVDAYSQKQVLRFEHLETSQGLSQSNVICILQDAKGFMWFGTRDGLNKYDGYGFTVYRNDPQNKNSLSHNTVEALAEDSQGNIWIGTNGGGLNKFDPSKGKFTRYIHDDKDSGSISGNLVRGNAMMIDSEKNLWIGTSTGLNKLAPNSNRFVHYMHSDDNPQSISNNDIRAICEDRRHNLWIGTEHGGLNLLNKKQQSFSIFMHDQNDTSSLSSDAVRSIFADSKNRLWAGTQGSGLNLLLDPAGKKFRHFQKDINNARSLSHNTVITVAESPEGQIWVGTENGGLNVLDPATGYFTRYMHDDIDRTSLNHNSIYCIYPDRNKDMWIGTFGGGANIVSRDANKFVTYHHTTSENSLSHNNILNIFEDSKNNLWIGTDGGGLNLFDRKTGTFTHFMHSDKNKNSICGNYVLEVFEDPKQNLWIGTWGDGLTVFNRKKNSYKHYRNNPADSASISSNNCWMVFQDSRSDIWVGTKGGGLNLYDPVKDNFIHFRKDASNPGSISSDFLTELFEDTKGNFWVGTDGEGLNLFDRKTRQFTHFTHSEAQNSLTSNIITCIFEDTRSNLWIGTDDGLNKLDRNTHHFSHYLTTDGLPNNFIHGILEDSTGNLWISTNKGLSKFDPAKKLFENFTVADGLQADEFKQSRCKTRSGTMYFGGVNGFNEFEPAKIKSISFDPSLVITGFRLFNKDVPISDDPSVSPLQKSITETKKVTLSYSNSVISIEFASLNYTIPEKKKYEYMLEGSDSKWNDIGTSRVATYTNLAPGNYTFKVRGLNNDGNWSHVITSFDLTITPPFWQTWWFRLLIILIVAGSAVGFHQVRMKVVNKQKRKLEEQVAELLDKAVAQGKYEIASDVMHDIGNAMVGFGAYLTRIRRILEQSDPEKLQKLVEFFTTNKSVMINAVGEAKADAIVKMLCGIALTQRSNQEEIGKSVTEQFNIISHVQEILNIQRQYIKGHESVERQPVNLKTVINDSMTMVFASLDKNAISVSLDIPADLPIIKGDRTKLMQMMLNILKNSIEAIDKNSTEKIISLSAYKQSNTLVVTLKDNGTGFDKPTSENLFKRGFTTKASGTGLGLYNCRAIVESHDGTIDITSEGPGKGTVTTIGFKLSA